MGTISWITPFSRCREVPYEIIDRDDTSDTRRLTYRFPRGAASCHYRIVSLAHKGSAALETGWEVTGYGDEASYHGDKAAGFSGSTPDLMSCYLVSTLEPKKPRRR